jgi:multidrug efflux pump subunit AcrA (membrane-fusion protein)
MLSIFGSPKHVVITSMENDLKVETIQSLSYEQFKSLTETLTRNLNGLKNDKHQFEKGQKLLTTAKIIYLSIMLECYSDQMIRIIKTVENNIESLNSSNKQVVDQAKLQLNTIINSDPIDITTKTHIATLLSELFNSPGILAKYNKFKDLENACTAKTQRAKAALENCNAQEKLAQQEADLKKEQASQIESLKTAIQDNESNIQQAKEIYDNLQADLLNEGKLQKALEIQETITTTISIISGLLISLNQNSETLEKQKEEANLQTLKLEQLRKEIVIRKEEIATDEKASNDADANMLKLLEILKTDDPKKIDKHLVNQCTYTVPYSNVAYHKHYNKTLAQEIHDEVIKHLSAALSQAEKIRTLVASEKLSFQEIEDLEKAHTVVKQESAHLLNVANLLGQNKILVVGSSEQNNERAVFPPAQWRSETLDNVKQKAETLLSKNAEITHNEAFKAAKDTAMGIPPSTPKVKAPQTAEAPKKKFSFFEFFKSLFSKRK